VNSLNTDAMIANLRTQEKDWDAQEIADGLTWYPRVNAEAIRMSRATSGKLPEYSAAGIIAVTSRQTSWGSNLAIAQYVARSLSEDNMVRLPEVHIQDAKESYGINIKNNARLAVQTDSLAAAYAIRAMGREERLTVLPEIETAEDASIKPACWSMGLRMLSAAVDLYRGARPDTVIPGLTLRNLFNNIIDPSDPDSVTIDSVMISACRAMRVEYGSRALDDLTKPIPADDGAFLEGCYPVFEDVIRKACAASNREHKTHLSPNEYQATSCIHWRHVVYDAKARNHDPTRYQVAA